MADDYSGTNQIQQPTIVQGPSEFPTLPKQYVGRLRKGSTTPSVINVLEWIAVNTVAISVTNFVDGQVGQTINILGDGFTTIVNGGKIITNTAANKLLLVNKVYTFTLRELVAGTRIWYERIT